MIPSLLFIGCLDLLLTALAQTVIATTIGGQCLMWLLLSVGVYVALRTPFN